MKQLIRLLNLCILLLFACILVQCNSSTEDQSFRFVNWNEESLLKVKDRLEKGDPSLQPALDRLIEEADEALDAGPYTVTDKPPVPPSGDKKDYMSVGPYWWPNPDTEDGMPYIHRDGEINPERDEYDALRMAKLSKAVQTLALAYFFTGHESYADHAAELLRIWFINEETAMNPHLRYTQAIPGRNDGRYFGLIDTTRLLDMLDAVELITLSNTWSSSDDAQLRDWFRRYNVWFIESEFGEKESNYSNNHGTWHDAQSSGFALFVRDTTTTLEVLKQVNERRIANHIEPDGRQPRELARTNGWHYSFANLYALIELAERGERLSIDIWNYETTDGRSITRALDWLLPHADGIGEDFTYQQISKPDWQLARIVYRRAARATGDSRYADVVSRIPGSTPDDRLRLLYPLNY